MLPKKPGDLGSTRVGSQMSWVGNKGQKNEGLDWGSSWGPVFCFKSVELQSLASPLLLIVSLPLFPLTLEAELKDASLAPGFSWCSVHPRALYY